MTNAAIGDGERAVLILSCATTSGSGAFSLPVQLVADELIRLHRTLDLLVEMGALAVYEIAAPAKTADDLTAARLWLREIVGGMIADAAIGASEHPCTPSPKPILLVPVWDFERDAGEPAILTAFGIFNRVPIKFEAMPVSDDLERPRADAAGWFRTWQHLMRDGFGTTAVPGADGPFVLVATLPAV